MFIVFSFLENKCLQFITSTILSLYETIVFDILKWQDEKNRVKWYLEEGGAYIVLL